jgi:hypothetical protein
MRKLFLEFAVEDDKGSATSRPVNGVGLGELRIFAVEIVEIHIPKNGANSS